MAENNAEILHLVLSKTPKNSVQYHTQQRKAANPHNEDSCDCLHVADYD